jgi:hypothetical protein
MCIDKMAPGQFSHEVILLSFLSAMPPMFHIHSAVIQEMDSRDCGRPVPQRQFYFIKRIEK